MSVKKNDWVQVLDRRDGQVAIERDQVDRIEAGFAYLRHERVGVPLSCCRLHLNQSSTPGGARVSFSVVVHEAGKPPREVVLSRTVSEAEKDRELAAAWEEEKKSCVNGDFDGCKLKNTKCVQMGSQTWGCGECGIAHTFG